MIRAVDSEKCCGCGACASVCPEKCITFAADGEGFLCPSVDAKKCVACNACERVCPMLSEPEKNTAVRAFAVINTDKEVRMKSSSGGVFGLLAEDVLAQGGAVFGAA